MPRWMNASLRSQSKSDPSKAKISLVRSPSGVQTAGRGHNAIHPQVFHHLPVVIEGVEQNLHGETEACRRALWHWRDRGTVDNHVLVVDGGHSPMKICERVLYVLDDIGFCPQRIRSGFVAHIGGWLLAKYRGTQHIVVRRCVLQLLSEGADTLEFPARRRKRILVLRHGVGKCHESGFFQTDKIVNHFTGCEAL